MNKGFKYYSEQYIHSITVHQNQENDVSVKAKCFRSQKRNECPHDLKVIFTGHEPQIEASCSCTIGLSGKCGHIAALLYQLAYFKQRNFKLIPADVAKTSLPQAWHIPRGEKLHGSKADDVVVYGYDRENPHRPTRGIKSTLYNPLPSDFQQDCDAVLDHFTDMNIMFNTVAGNTSEMVQTKFGRQQKGCVLSYQQKLSSEYLVNFVDVATFPELPVRNTMINNINTVLNEKQTKLFESLKMSQSECQEVEEFTRLQSNDLRWHKIRSQRITASNAGEIAKRRAGKIYPITCNFAPKIDINKKKP
ncbi:uncharacterized protein [Argopecten irradians]|uniref:uncharacterized protein n=1 Tax=Argopecten irradians TaxID=31199 RepID=UPI003711A7D5